MQHSHCTSAGTGSTIPLTPPSWRDRRGSQPMSRKYPTSLPGMTMSVHARGEPGATSMNDGILTGNPSIPTGDAGNIFILNLLESGGLDISPSHPSSQKNVLTHINRSARFFMALPHSHRHYKLSMAPRVQRTARSSAPSQKLDLQGLHARMCICS